MNSFQCRQNNTMLSPFYQCETTWLEDWRELFRVQDLFPDFHQNIHEQFNCSTRIILFLIILLYLFYGLNKYIWILVVILFGMIILYITIYKKVRFSAMRENYRPEENSNYKQPSIILYDSTKPEQRVEISGKNNNPSLIDIKNANFWCHPDTPLGEETTSLNQSLVGDANPKTRIRPVIPPPIYDQDTWTPNDFIVPYKINDYKRQELYQNGYMSWEEDKSMCDLSKKLFNTYGCLSNKKEVKENFDSSSYPRIPPKTEEYINTNCGGYFPENSKYNYPVNVPPNQCMASPSMMEYNKNLYQIPIQPGVSTSSQVNQPDASMYNLGISFTQPRLPYSCEMDDRGNMLFQEYDPNQYPSEYMLKGRDQYGRDNIQRHEIYDPRLTGYGTSYRSYIDPMTGQPRYYYDDIEAHTQYNFISRNNIDHTRFAPTAGPYEGLPPTDSRMLANLTYTNDTLKRRTELQYNLMRKNSHREWQRRTAPIMRAGYGPAGCGPQSVDSYAGPRGSTEYNYYY